MQTNPALIIALITIVAHPLIAIDLAIARSGNTVRLSWPLTASNNFYLQFTTNLAASPAWNKHW